MKYAFWPGCVARGAAPELYKSTLAVAKHIGIELDELEAAACTGAGIISDADPYLQDVLNARTLAIAEQKNLPLMDICSTCIGVHSLAREKLENLDYRARINERLAPEGLEYTGTVEPRHLLWIILEDLEEGKLKHLIRKPLEELKPLFESLTEPENKLIFSCGSGLTACVLALAAHLAGYENLSVYDGSWSEWGVPGHLPVVSD